MKCPGSGWAPKSETRSTCPYCKQPRELQHGVIPPHKLLTK